MGVCTIRGQVLGPSDFDLAAGKVISDMSAVRLTDGRIRLYMPADGRGIVSALSLTSDGLTFVSEPSVRLPEGSGGMARAVVLADGSIRLFTNYGNGITSWLSTDGLTFTQESGFRLTNTAAGLAATTTSTVAALSDGRYRMYFSDLPRPGETPGGHLVKSAVSTDMLAWTVEDGVRLGTGATVLTGSAEHPYVLTNPDGSVTLYYGKFQLASADPEGLYQSTSTDGLTFETETLAVFFGNDPDAVRLVDGTLLVYYGGFDNAVGGTINAAACPDPTS